MDYDNQFQAQAKMQALASANVHGNGERTARGSLLQQGYGAGGDLSAPPKQPFLAQIENLISEAQQRASATTMTQHQLLLRVFGSYPTIASQLGATAGIAPASPSAEDRIFDSLRLLISTMAETQDQAERLDSRL